MSPLEEAKERIDIPEAARLLGIILPKDSGLMSSPFREDRKPSFSIFADGRAFKDQGTGDKGGVVNFVALATGRNGSDASKLLIELAETGKGYTYTNPMPRRTYKAAQAPSKKPNIPPLDQGSPKERGILTRQRGWPIAIGLDIFYELGVFGFCYFWDVRCWLVTDPSGLVAQVRRLDAKPFPNGLKEITLKNSKACYPVGFSSIKDADIVIITEGCTDFLTSIALAYMELDGQISNIGFCGILGAEQIIHKDALSNLNGKNIIIYADNDIAGIAAAKKWRDQLQDENTKVIIRLPDVAKQDLNDEACMKWGEWDEGDPLPSILEIETLYPAKIQRNVNNQTKSYNENTSRR